MRMSHHSARLSGRVGSTAAPTLQATALRTLAFGALLSGSLAGCTVTPSSTTFRSAIPTGETLKIDFPTATLTNNVSAACTSSDDPDACNCYANSRYLVDNVNNAITGALSRLATAASHTSTELATDVYQWGPNENTLYGVFDQLQATHNPDGSFVYVLQVAQTEAGPFQNLIEGHVAPNSSGASGTGSFIVYYDVQAALETTSEAVGTLKVGKYQLDSPEKRSLSVTVSNFRFDSGTIHNAALTFARADDQSAQLDWLFLRDAYGNVDAPETLSFRNRWLGDTAGRCDGYTYDGDLGTTEWTSSQCWDSSSSQVFTRTLVDGSVRSLSGLESTCAYQTASYP